MLGYTYDRPPASGTVRCSSARTRQEKLAVAGTTLLWGRSDIRQSVYRRQLHTLARAKTHCSRTPSPDTRVAIDCHREWRHR